MCLNRTQEHKTQTADNTIFYLAKGFEGLYLECYRNPTKLLTLKITLTSAKSSNKGREIKNHSLKSVNFIFLEWNSGISSFLPLNQSVMSVWSIHFRLSLNV